VEEQDSMAAYCCCRSEFRGSDLPYCARQLLNESQQGLPGVDASTKTFSKGSWYWRYCCYHYQGWTAKFDERCAVFVLAVIASVVS
jgi:hypothetical protein